MKVSNLKERFQQELKEQFPIQEIDSFFYRLSEKYLNIKRIDLALDPSVEIDQENQLLMEGALGRLMNSEPIQYITGHTEFYGMTFQVNKNVLIPRPETEELVEWIIEDSDKAKKLDILDIGTGSGCIAISLAKDLPEAKVFAIDISEEALKIARMNAEANDVSVEFQHKDILETNSLNQQFDVIVSNPPYVRELEKSSMHANVLEHEPKQALYVEDSNALIFYHKIAQLAKENLSKDGSLYFEINQYLGQETLAIIKNLGFEAELKKDIFGNDRMIKAYFND